MYSFHLCVIICCCSAKLSCCLNISSILNLYISHCFIDTYILYCLFPFYIHPITFACILSIVALYNTILFFCRHVHSMWSLYLICKHVYYSCVSICHAYIIRSQIISIATIGKHLTSIILANRALCSLFLPKLWAHRPLSLNTSQY